MALKHKCTTYLQAYVTHSCNDLFPHPSDMYPRQRQGMDNKPRSQRVKYCPFSTTLSVEVSRDLSLILHYNFFSSLKEILHTTNMSKSVTSVKS